VPPRRPQTKHRHPNRVSEHYFQDKKLAPTVTGDTITLHIPTANVLDEAAVWRFAAWKAAISKQAKGVQRHA
jgi:hypothetical protein